VVALGGNAIKQEKKIGTFEEQYGHVNQAACEIAQLHKLGHRLVSLTVTDLRQGICSFNKKMGKSISAQPLDCVGAMTQG